jgi:hypothetical protein
MPPCRPSFTETNDNDQLNKLDRHFWSNVSILSKPCAFCKRKSVSSSLFGTNRPSTMPTTDMISTNTTITTTKSPIPGSPQLYGTSGGFQCLWCSRGYHRRCWEQAFSHDEKNKCDYGIYRYNYYQKKKKKFFCFLEI